MPKEIKPKKLIYKKVDYYKAIQDMAAYLRISETNKPKQLLFTLTHDILGLANKNDKFFVPKTSGYADNCPDGLQYPF